MRQTQAQGMEKFIFLVLMLSAYFMPVPTRLFLCLCLCLFEYSLNRPNTPCPADYPALQIMVWHVQPGTCTCVHVRSRTFCVQARVSIMHQSESLDENICCLYSFDWLGQDLSRNRAMAILTKIEGWSTKQWQNATTTTMIFISVTNIQKDWPAGS